MGISQDVCWLQSMERTFDHMFCCQTLDRKHKVICIPPPPHLTPNPTPIEKAQVCVNQEGSEDICCRSEEGSHKGAAPVLPIGHRVDPLILHRHHRVHRLVGGDKQSHDVRFRGICHAGPGNLEKSTIGGFSSFSILSSRWPSSLGFFCGLLGAAITLCSENVGIFIAWHPFETVQLLNHYHCTVLLDSMPEQRPLEAPSQAALPKLTLSAFMIALATVPDPLNPTSCWNFCHMLRLSYLSYGGPHVYTLSLHVLT